MRKTPPRLALCKETLRAISGLGLARAVGGQAAEAALAEEVTVGMSCHAAALVMKG